MAPVLADDRVYRVAAAVEAALDQRRGGPLLDAIRRPPGLPAPGVPGPGAPGSGAPGSGAPGSGASDRGGSSA
jgi:hypothetical protein